jgi:hypothetical protein
LKSDFLLHDAAGSQISPLHYAAGRQISPLHFALCSGGQIFPLHCVSLLHLTVGSQILPLHFVAGSQILLLHDATGSQILPLHNAAGSQILPPHDAAGSQSGIVESSLQTLEDSLSPLRGNHVKNHMGDYCPTIFKGLFDFFLKKTSKELEKKCHATVFTMDETKRIKLCGIL